MLVMLYSFKDMQKRHFRKKGSRVAERSELSSLESIIEQNLRSFYDAGVALTKIRDSRLYRESHATFDKYCKERWGFYRDQADRLISASKTMDNLTPVGVKPSNEAQVRPLTKLEPEQQIELWKRVVETAPENQGSLLVMPQAFIKLNPCPYWRARHFFHVLLGRHLKHDLAGEA